MLASKASGIRAIPDPLYAFSAMAPPRNEAKIRAMESSAPRGVREQKAEPVAQVNVDDDSVEIFLRGADGRRVVIATLDEHGRLAYVAEWDPATAGQLTNHAA